MYFIDHTNPESNAQGSHSKRNTYEARKIFEALQYLVCENNVPASKITVLCSYRGQASTCITFLLWLSEISTIDLSFVLLIIMLFIMLIIMLIISMLIIMLIMLIIMLIIILILIILLLYTL